MPERSSPQPPERSSWPVVLRTLAPYMHLGWTLVGSVVLGLLGGRWVDTWLNTTPWCFILGAVLGIAVGLY